MRQNGVPDASVTPYFRETTPCENELFATDGQIISREGSHNVKKMPKILLSLLRRHVPTKHS